MDGMFCFQCEQTAGGKGCTVKGVCGKQPDTAARHDELTASLIGLARAAKGKKPGKKAKEIMIEGLFAVVTNVNFDNARFDEFIRRLRDGFKFTIIVFAKQQRGTKNCQFLKA